MARVVRLTEQQLTGLVQNILNMALNPNKSSSTTDSESSDTSVDSSDEDLSSDDGKSKETLLGKISAKGQELLNNRIFYLPFN